MLSVSSLKSKALKRSNLIFDMNTKKCYVVIEYGGEWEDKWENVVCVFIDKTKAEEFVKQNTDLELTISLEEFGMLQEVILQKMNDSENSLPWPELIQKYFPGEPRYTLEELRKTEEAQTREDYDWYGYMIEERDLCL